MPNRVIRSGFLDSEKINSLKPDEQIFFIRLMLIADDFGCCDGRPEMIKSHAYPVSDIRLSSVRQWLSSCQKAGLILAYEADGKKFLFIPNFDQRLRQKKRRYPEPKGLDKMTGMCLTGDGHVQATMPESESESETKPNKNYYSEDFLTFWKAYPNKTGKGAAWKSWQTNNPLLQECLDALKWQVSLNNWVKENGKYIPMPQTYLNQRRWEDEQTTVKPKQRGRVENGVTIL